MSAGTIAVVAEKPSVARDLARALSATRHGEGYLHGEGYVVTWAIGHLVGLAQPGEMRPEWKSWRRDQLPMLPHDWPLVVVDQTKDQYEIVRRILTSPRVAKVICATDAGREGELIFRYIYESAGCDKPVERLWISSLTPDAIRAGFAALRDGHQYDPLADAARGRSRADWLVGMNLSRAYTLSCNEEISVGRVQTPTLAMLVERELAIRDFVPENYINVVARFSPGPGREYTGTWFNPAVKPLEAASKLPPDGVEAEAIVERVRGGGAAIERIEAQEKRFPAPGLYDLTELQRHANRLYGFSAQRTLEIAQSLYEKHKLISYPRTDSRHLTDDVARTLPKIVPAISEPYRELLAPGTGTRPLGKRFVDDAKVSDHHAIIPTGVALERTSADADERKLFDLVCRRLLSAWHADHVQSVTTIITLVRSSAEDRFHSSGTAILENGWKVLDIAGKKKDENAPTLPSGLAEGQPQKVAGVEAVAKKTTPPKRLTDASLLTAMETAGKTLDDKELSDAMKECGLGTPATRAQIIETLLKRGFIERRGKSFEATDKGIRLIAVVHPEVKSPAMTGQWEAHLKRIERGEAPLAPFIHAIEDYVREVIGKAATGGTPLPTASMPPPTPLLASRTGTPHEVLKICFGFDSFRPNQEEVCRAVASGHDVLLVMPTGSGKSLCYQLPGVMSGGTTIVISPLIALMEDQVAKLNALGFRADRIHSNRNRVTSRDVSQAYLEGKLDFLFIAPERLRVRGFPELLARRKPSLIAIDEAHCISQWGHDFRPDYRQIGVHLPALRPAPVIALTATATPLVQTDIARQLGLDAPRFMIHGFRRDNLAIEVVELSGEDRAGVLEDVLKPAERRPAIVYTLRRKDAEHIAATLGRDFHTAAYHAGIDGARRDEVQSAFLAGKLDVIVATIAFGMGIDKADVRTVVHTGLPSSMEGYYQEIGRAGRDGKPSRAILLHSYADRFTHDYFFEHSYPDPKVLEGVFKLLRRDPAPRELIFASAKLDGDVFAAALEKLWIHGGAIVDSDDNLSVGDAGWRASYVEQREHKQAQFEKMLRFTRGHACRMASLVEYFGDTTSSRERCGVCDFCDPRAAVALTYRAPTRTESTLIERILDSLADHDRIATGRLYQECFPSGEPARQEFERLLAAMTRGGLIEVNSATFEKDGKSIAFERVTMRRAGLEPGAAEQALLPTLATSDAEPKPRKLRIKGKKKAKGKVKTKVAPPPVPANTEAIATLLRAWRLAEAKRKRIPAFRVLTDKALEAIAAAQPRTSAELVAVPGMGLKLADKYGDDIFRIVRSVR